MNQAELASKARIRANTLGDLENRRKNSRLETLEAVAEALGYSVGELYCELDQALKEKQSNPAFSRDDEEFQCSNEVHRKLQKMLEEILHRDEMLGGLIADSIRSFHAALPHSSDSANDPLPERKYFSPEDEILPTDSASPKDVKKKWKGQ